MKTLEVFLEKPKEFVPAVEVSACYVDVRGRLLLLELSPHKQETGKWGVPAGKIETGEKREEAAQRELFEETGLELDACCFTHLGTLYMKKPSLSYTYHLFHVRLEDLKEVVLSKEHQGYLWATWEQMEELPLMTGAQEALNHYKLISKTTFLHAPKV